MRITKQALRAFNAGRDASFNDCWNAQQRIGTKAEHDAIHRVGKDQWGLCWDRKAQKVTGTMLEKAGHSLV